MKSFEEIIKGHNVIPYEAQEIIAADLKKVKTSVQHRGAAINNKSLEHYNSQAFM
jgi:hypothetical protein